MVAKSNSLFVLLVTVLSCSSSLVRFAESKVPQDEIDALQEITSTMGAKFWKFNGDSCTIEMAGVTADPPPGSDGNITCDCNSTVCHVVKLVLKGYSLPGILPPQLVKLRYLKIIDLSRNYLNGTIPGELGAMQLTDISLLVNRLSGEIPKELGNITTLRHLILEENQFSGVVPPELGNLIHLRTLMWSSNRLTGKLPVALARLRNLTDVRINNNNFNGTIPDFIQNWEKLERLEMHASGLQGPIPSNISLLSNLQELRISDIKGPQQGFPTLTDMTGLVKLVLRNCNISGEIPPYIWTIQSLQMLSGELQLRGPENNQAYTHLRWQSLP